MISIVWVFVQLFKYWVYSWRVASITCKMYRKVSFNFQSQFSQNALGFFSFFRGVLGIYIGNKVTRLCKKCTKACRFGGVKPVGSSYDTIYVCRGTETNEKLIRRVCYRNFVHRSERRVWCGRQGVPGKICDRIPLLNAPWLG